jgi:predicted dehydrogenase
MRRRTFLKAGAAGMAWAGAIGSQNSSANNFDDTKPRRVGLIGSGWYGKCDLFRLIQVAPIEVVSICDVDSKMLADAAEQVAGRQASKKTPRTYSDYNKMLAEKDLDLVLIATPDHQHALPAIAAIEAGCDLYLQKPISVDVIEGQAILDAARSHNRVVQVGLQRRSTPHLIEARDRIIREGKLGQIGLVEIYCYYHMRSRDNAPDIEPPPNLDWDAWTGPAPMRPYNRIVHPRGWRSFQEYGNGILGDMCVHMLDTVRWMMGLGWPRRISSSGAGGHVRLRRRAGRLAASDMGLVARPEVSVGHDLLRRQGHAEGERDELRFHAAKRRLGDPRRREVRAGRIPRGQGREGSGKTRRPGDPASHERLARCRRCARTSGVRHRTGAHLDRQLRAGEPLARTRPVPRLGSEGRACDR